jgi:hypothetical protein
MGIEFLTSYIVIWVVVLFQSLLIVALLRELRELQRLVRHGSLLGADRLPTGAPVPKFAGVDWRSGQQVGNHSLNGIGGIVVFLSSDCSTCRDFAVSLRQPAIDGLPPIIAFCKGGEQGCQRLLKMADARVHLLLKGAEETAALFQVTGFPTAVVIDAKQRVRGYGHPKNIEDLKRLLEVSLDVSLKNTGVEETPELAKVTSG